MNLRFVDESNPGGPLETIAALTRDAPGITNRPGPRKPLVSEILDVLADRAARRGCSRIAIVNGDICVRQAAVDRITSGEAPAVALSRLDVGGGQPDEMLLRGVDMVAFDVAFWRAERRRFRAYILGEPLWDNVYASIVVCHGGLIINREPLITHERHQAGGDSPFARYAHVLATRDAAYFSRWCGYVSEAARLRAKGGSIDAEYALQRALFTPPGRGTRAADALRGAWWALRHRFG